MAGIVYGNDGQPLGGSGVALDGQGKIPATYLPSSIMDYKGAWDPSSNSPALSDGSGSVGDLYRVTANASRNLGSGTATYDIGDYVVANASGIWEKIDTTDAVSSVAGKTGTVTLTSSDVGLGNVTNDAQIPASALDTDSTFAANSDAKVSSQKAIKTALENYVAKSTVGSASGVAGLDAGGKVPVSQLPNSIMEYQGIWDASTNSPSLSDGVGGTGDVYRVGVAGSRNLGSGTATYDVGDYVINNASGIWEKADTTDAVSSVAGRTGAVTLSSSDVGLGNVTNDTQLRAADLDTDSTLAANSDTKVPSQKAVKTALDAKAPAASPTFTGTTSAPTPTLGDSSTQIATTAFVANAGSVQEVRAAHSSSSITISNPGTAVLGGSSLSSGDLVLLFGQSTGSQNGPWVFNGSSSALTRPTWWAAGSSRTSVPLIYAREGTNADKLYGLTTNGTITVDTTSVAFSAIAVPGAIGTGGGTVSSSLTLDTSSWLIANGRLTMSATQVTGNSALDNSSSFRQAYTGAGGHTITLTTAGSGNRLTLIENQGTGNLTVARSSTDTITYQGVTGQTSITLVPGQAVLFATASASTTVWFGFDLGIATGTITSTHIADGTIVNADINASAAIALSKLATDPLARANHTGTQTLSTISDAGTAASAALDTDGTLSANSDTRVPSQKAIKTYVAANAGSLGYTAEDVANKDTDSTFAANSDVKYPSQKAVKTALDGKASATHTHAIADVTSLQTSLDGKAAATHGHAISEITNLQTTLDGKQASLGFTAEDAANKDTDSTFAANSDTKYPSQKAVKSALANYVLASSIGVASGVAGLDAGGKVPVSQLPNSIMEYQGLWNPSANTPVLVDGTGNTGDVYRISTAGSRNLGSGTATYDVGDYVIYNASGIWEKADTTDAVSSVAGRTGAVTLTSSDVGLGNVTNDAQLKVADLDTDSTFAANSDTKIPSQKAVKTALDGKQASLGFTAENVANKDTDSTFAANSDTKYPSQKAVKTALDGKAASVHTHAISDVTNLQTSLDGKAAATHTHAISEITNLQTTLDGKQASLGFTAENVANKDTDSTFAANSDTKYPSQKAVKSALANYVLASSIGVASGVAGLDAGGKVPVSQLPNSIMAYQGVWDASTNTPSLADGGGGVGDVYRVSVAGSRNLGSGTVTYDIGDYVISNASSIWEKADTTDAVSSVAGRTGAVTLTSTDVGLGNVSNATQIPLSYLDTDVTLAANSDTKVPSQKAVKTYIDSATGSGTLVDGGAPDVSYLFKPVVDGGIPDLQENYVTANDVSGGTP